MAKRKIEVIVGKSPNRAGAENYAIGFRRGLRFQHKTVNNRVKIKRVSGGFVAVYYKPNSKKE